MTAHSDITTLLPTWHAALLLGPALAALASAALAGPGRTAAGAWRAARWATSTGLALAVLSLAAMVAGSHGPGHGLRADGVGGVMLLLVTFIGWVIVRYSQPYLHGEDQERHYVRWLMTTLATVGVVVVTNHMLVLALAWTATSLALHRLLTFFRDRPPAVVAAHKKFIVARAADLCMVVAVVLLYRAFGTLDIDRIASQVATAPQPPWTAQAAAVLVAFAALLKCAQLPFHGWLIQVMEAPTPVSALLHAGVVNLGGFVLIRLAPLVAEVPAAQGLLVAAGATTAVLAGLVMTTRISIKVSLAWSTCAQMGFMLMQCGLGLWEMALLHLVAHSLYKAHAFLSAGGAVRRTLLAQLTPRAEAPGPLALAAGALTGVAMTLAAGAAWHGLAPAQAGSPARWVLAAILALALVPLVYAQSPRLRGPWLATLGLGAFGVAFACFGLHALASAWLPPQPATPPAPLWIAVALAFGALFIVQTSIALRPQSALARRLYPWFYGGLFLDEHFTRVVSAAWPPPSPTPAAPLLPSAEATLAFTATPAPAGARP
jgi:NAD(P)H-quinone oxidoreductase subunit 5